MGVDHKARATCRHCGASINLFSIFNRSMTGLAKSWRKKHERGCEGRTAAERAKWARAKRKTEAVEIDWDHPGMQEPHR